jgi:transcription elongation factor Elf1
MTCPECGSADHERVQAPHSLRKPVVKWGTTWRVHRCLSCGKMFMSQQRSLTMEDADVWMEHLDSSTWTLPTSSSEPAPTSEE